MTNQLEAQFYFGAVIDHDGECQRVSDTEAQFWTVYERNADGLSSAICDCTHRNDAVTATERFNALIAAMEQSQRENDDLRQRHANSEHQLYMTELAKNNLRASRRAQFHKRRSAEKRIAELESEIEKAKSCLPYYKDKNFRIEGSWIGSVQNYIVSLEARQLAVKLPGPLMPAQHASGELFMTHDNVEHGGYLNRDDVLRSLKKAGITVQGDE